MAASAIFLVGLVLVDALGSRWFRTSPEIWPGALLLLGVWALGGDWWQELRMRRRASDWVPVAQFQDVSDALRARRDLMQKRSPEAVVLTGLRYRSLTYFFGPFIPLILWERSPSP